MLAVLIAVLLGLLEWRFTRWNQNRDCNGYGALLGTLKRENAAPMRYRVLMAWLLLALARPLRFVIRPVHYQVLKVALLAGALVVAWLLLGVPGMLAVALGVALTLEFDYWDCYGELLGVGLVLWGASRGCPYTVAAGGVVWGLSKETALLSVTMAVLGGQSHPWAWVAGLAGPVTMAVVRLVQRRDAPLYCERWTLRAYNVPDLKEAWGRGDVGPWLSLAWTVGTVVAVAYIGRSSAVPLQATAAVAPCWLVAGWTMARARETRVFLPTVLWMAAAVNGWGNG